MTSRKPSRSHQHAAVERISIAGATTYMAPYALHHYGEEFLQAALSLPAPTVPFSPVRFYLACHSIELSLKAFLSLNRVSLATIKKCYGHGLLALLTAVEQKGLGTLVLLSDAQLVEIRNASAYYSEKVLEYPSSGEALKGYPATAELAVLLSAAELLVARLREPCIDAA